MTKVHLLEMTVRVFSTCHGTRHSLPCSIRPIGGPYLNQWLRNPQMQTKLNINLLSTPWSTPRTRSFRFSYPSHWVVSSLLYATIPSTPSHIHPITFRENYTKLFTINFSPASRHFLLLSPNIPLSATISCTFGLCFSPAACQNNKMYITAQSNTTVY